MKTNFVVEISPPISYLAKFSFSMLPANQIALLCLYVFDWICMFVFCVQINIRFLYKLILLFWVCATRHAQRTQNEKFTYLFNICSKA